MEEKQLIEYQNQISYQQEIINNFVNLNNNLTVEINRLKDELASKKASDTNTNLIKTLQETQEKYNLLIKELEEEKEMFRKCNAELLKLKNEYALIVQTIKDSI